MELNFVDLLAILASLVTIAGGIAITIRYFRDEQERHPAVIWGTIFATIIILFIALLITRPFGWGIGVAAATSDTPSTATPDDGMTAPVILTATPSVSMPQPTATVPRPSPTPTETILFAFEDGTTEGWVATGDAITGVSNSTERAYLGNHSLAVSFVGLTSASQPYVSAPINQNVNSGATLEMYVYVPSPLAFSAQLFVLSDGTFIGQSPQNYTVLTPGIWNKLDFTLPPQLIDRQVSQVGLQFYNPQGSEDGTIWIDSVRWIAH